MELLVVIAIIGVLAALLLPALSMAKAHARSTACKNHLRQMGIALQMYVHDHQNRYPHYLGPPGPSYGDATGPPGRAVDLVYWSSKLFPYYPLNWTNKAFHCPGYRGAITGPYPDGGRFLAGSVARFGSYGYNIEGSQSGSWSLHVNLGLGPPLWWNYPPVTEGQVKVPSEMLSISESRFLTAAVVRIPGGIEQSGPGGYDELHCGNLTGELFDPARHGKNYNVLLCDDHVCSMSPWTLFNPTNTAAMWNYDHQPHPELWGR